MKKCDTKDLYFLNHNFYYKICLYLYVRLINPKNIIIYFIELNDTFNFFQKEIELITLHNNKVLNICLRGYDVFASGRIFYKE